jgi:hypothetical protein
MGLDILTAILAALDLYCLGKKEVNWPFTAAPAGLGWENTGKMMGEATADRLQSQGCHSPLSQQDKAFSLPMPQSSNL